MTNKMCQQAKADIYFLVDQSKTVKDTDMEIIVLMMRNMIRSFSYGEDSVKVAFGSFAQSFGEIFSFADYDTRHRLLKRL
jgi:hypothetical protein